MSAVTRRVCICHYHPTDTRIWAHFRKLVGLLRAYNCHDTQTQLLTVPSSLLWVRVGSDTWLALLFLARRSPYHR